MARVKKIRYRPPIPWSISCFLKRAAYTANAHRAKRSPLKNWPPALLFSMYTYSRVVKFELQKKIQYNCREVNSNPRKCGHCLPLSPSLSAPLSFVPLTVLFDRKCSRRRRRRRRCRRHICKNFFVHEIAATDRSPRDKPSHARLAFACRHHTGELKMTQTQYFLKS